MNISFVNSLLLIIISAIQNCIVYFFIFQRQSRVTNFLQCPRVIVFFSFPPQASLNYKINTLWATFCSYTIIKFPFFLFYISSLIIVCIKLVAYTLRTLTGIDLINSHFNKLFMTIMDLLQDPSNLVNKYEFLVYKGKFIHCLSALPPFQTSLIVRYPTQQIENTILQCSGSQTGKKKI